MKKALSLILILIFILFGGCHKGIVMPPSSITAGNDLIENSAVSSTELSSKKKTNSYFDPVNEPLGRCEDNENEYYYIAKDPQGYELCRKSKTTGVTATIDTARCISCLTLADGWLYYASDRQNLCRARVTGADRSILWDYESLLQYEEDDMRLIYVVNRTLFIRQQSFPLYRFDLQTQAVDEVYSDAREIGMLGSNIYFSGRECTIYKMNAHDKEPTAILMSEMEGNDKEKWRDLYKNFIFVGETMYYYKRSPDGLYCYRGGESTLIDDDSYIDEFSMREYDGKLYYAAKNALDYKATGKRSATLMCYDPSVGEISKAARCDGFVDGGDIIDDVYHYIDSSENEREVRIK